MSALSRALRRLGATLALVAATGAAHAHGASDAWLALRSDATGAAVRVDVALRDLDLALGLDADGDGTLTAGEVDARRPDLERLVLGAMDFRAGGRRCTPGPVAASWARRGDGAYAVLRFALDCGAPATRLDVGYRLFADVDASHRAIVVPAGRAPQPLRPGPEALSVELGAADRDLDDGRAFAGFFVEGLRHILDGVDHLAFVVALALASVALARRVGTPLRDAVAGLLGRVTLFTLAHSITLAGVALGGLALPSRWVESAIAASVAIAGLQVLRIARGEATSAAPPWLVFAFGLIHGFGFGSALSGIGPDGRQAAVALLGFNLGVEAGQLAVLALAFPLAWSARGTRAYGRAVQPALAVLMVVAGLLWLADRAIGLDALDALASAG